MKEKLFSIGEISKVKGITVKALRFYEKIGLLMPCYTDPATKYRYYSIDQFWKLDIIKASRIMDISPKEIKTVLDKKDTGFVLDYMDRQKENAREKILDINRRIFVINAFQHYVQISKESISKSEVYYKDIPERHIITIAVDSHINKESAYPVYAKACKIVEENRLLNTFENGFICGVTNNQYVPVELFCSVGTDDSSETSLLSSIQAGSFLCVCFNEHNAREQQNKLCRYIEENKLVPKQVLLVLLMDDLFKTDLQSMEMQMLI